LAALLCLELNDAAALGATGIIVENIDSNNVSRLAHMVLELLPIGIPVEIREKYTSPPHRILIFLKIVLVKHLISNHLAFRILLTITVFPKQV
jgi:hypothetical protein